MENVPQNAFPKETQELTHLQAQLGQNDKLGTCRIIITYLSKLTKGLLIDCTAPLQQLHTSSRWYTEH